jgi:hypothetical protein
MTQKFSNELDAPILSRKMERKIIIRSILVRVSRGLGRNSSKPKPAFLGRKPFIKIAISVVWASWSRWEDKGPPSGQSISSKRRVN